MNVNLRHLHSFDEVAFVVSLHHPYSFNGTMCVMRKSEIGSIYVKIYLVNKKRREPLTFCFLKKEDLTGIKDTKRWKKVIRMRHF
jgi:hypothetical protein